MKRILTKIFSRNFIFIAMLLLQIAFIAFMEIKGTLLHYPCEYNGSEYRSNSLHYK